MTQELRAQKLEELRALKQQAAEADRKLALHADNDPALHQEMSACHKALPLNPSLEKSVLPGMLHGLPLAVIWAAHEGCARLYGFILGVL